VLLLVFGLDGQLGQPCRRTILVGTLPSWQRGVVAGIDAEVVDAIAQVMELLDQLRRGWP
jgi:hypothetical protein